MWAQFHPLVFSIQGFFLYLHGERETSFVAPNLYKYIAAGQGNKKISFPFSPTIPHIIKRLLSTKGASAISPMQ
jgi:hypothetical protein